MRKPGSTTIDGKGKPKPAADNKKPLDYSADVAAKRVAQAAKEVTSE